MGDLLVHVAVFVVDKRWICGSPLFCVKAGFWLEILLLMVYGRDYRLLGLQQLSVEMMCPAQRNINRCCSGTLSLRYQNKVVMRTVARLVPYNLGPSWGKSGNKLSQFL